MTRDLFSVDAYYYRAGETQNAIPANIEQDIDQPQVGRLYIRSERNSFRYSLGPELADSDS